MTLPITGPISLLDIGNEFNDTTPYSLGEYYGVFDGIPTSGQLSINHFYGAALVQNTMLAVTVGRNVIDMGMFGTLVFTGFINTSIGSCNPSMFNGCEIVEVRCQTNIGGMHPNTSMTYFSISSTTDDVEASWVVGANLNGVALPVLPSFTTSENGGIYTSSWLWNLQNTAAAGAWTEGQVIQFELLK